MDERPLPSIPVQHFVSPFGEFRFCHWKPPELAGLVEELWYSRGVLHVRRERLFPTGTIELVLSLGGLYQITEGAGTPAVACLGGLQTGPLVLEHAPTHESIGVCFTPAGAHALIGAPVHELTGRLVDLVDVLGPDARALADRCEAATSVAGRFHVITAWIAARLARGPRLDPRVAAIVAALEASGGTAAIAELRERAGLSKTRLAALFREQIGATPKLYARLVRFRRALEFLKKADPRSFAAVAHAAGYYDQPHMNADFRELGGLTPGDIVASSYVRGVTAAEPG